MKKKNLYDHKFCWLKVSKINDPEFEVKGDTWDQVMNFAKGIVHALCMMLRSFFFVSLFMLLPLQKLEIISTKYMKNK